MKQVVKSCYSPCAFQQSLLFVSCSPASMLSTCTGTRSTSAAPNAMVTSPKVRKIVSFSVMGNTTEVCGVFNIWIVVLGSRYS